MLALPRARNTRKGKRGSEEMRVEKRAMSGAKNNSASAGAHKPMRGLDSYVEKHHQQDNK
jgi:hypothetical protein